MLDQDTRVTGEELQFDRVTTESTAAAPPSTLAVNCAACRTPIDTEYFDVNGMTCCSLCRTAAESAAQTPRGIVPLIGAGAYGLGAGVVGAVIYYAVIAIANLEIGLVAILIGYMVGYAVRKGARGRGGLRFQVLAVALTYASIALAYAPFAIKQGIDADRDAPKAAATTTSNRDAAGVTDSARAATTKPDRRGILLGFLILTALIAALPVLVVVSSLPLGLISAFIMFVGMRQAWRMTGTPWLQILGPYRVGAVQSPIPV